MKITMRLSINVVLMIMSISSINVWADDTLNKTTCNDPEINKQWNDAVIKYKHDPLVVKLHTVRLNLCELVIKQLIDTQVARMTWEQSVISTLIEKGKQVTTTTNKDGESLLQLFGNF
jgi:hypothetical protein